MGTEGAIEETLETEKIRTKTWTTTCPRNFCNVWKI